MISTDLVQQIGFLTDTCNRFIRTGLYKEFVYETDDIAK